MSDGGALHLKNTFGARRRRSPVLIKHGTEQGRHTDREKRNDPCECNDAELTASESAREGQLHLKNVRANCPGIEVLARHARTFATMITECQGERVRSMGTSTRIKRLKRQMFGRAGFALLHKRVPLA
ncbi:hypothetical protein OG285_36625 (plasmid) [Streptomyces sp. NBC_01471]|uniref:hypothetical protein n=1 Tax=Streptomyces sp. NBC_01471 TaxID=2903879 RepID=UPI002F90B10D